MRNATVTTLIFLALSSIASAQSPQQKLVQAAGDLATVYAERAGRVCPKADLPKTCNSEYAVLITKVSMFKANPDNTALISEFVADSSNLASKYGN